MAKTFSVAWMLLMAWQISAVTEEILNGVQAMVIASQPVFIQRSGVWFTARLRQHSSIRSI
jgi:hypothetical protein